MEIRGPYETLGIRLTETLERAVGGILRPWQVRRVGRADADALAYKLEKIEGVRHVIAMARAGDPAALRRVLGDQAEGLLAIGQGQSHEGADGPATSEDWVASYARAEATLSSIEESLNLAGVAAYAEEGLPPDAAERAAGAKQVDPDWLRQWRDYARRVSAADLQKLWAEVLVEQVQDPGAFSFRTMHVLSTLSRDDALLVKSLAPFVSLDGVVYRGVGQLEHPRIPEVLEAGGLDFTNLMWLEKMGILSSGLGGPMAKTYSLEARPDGERTRLIAFRERALVVSHPTRAEDLVLLAYAVTPAGLQILHLVDEQASSDYIDALADLLKSAGFKVGKAPLRTQEDGKHVVDLKTVVYE